MRALAVSLVYALALVLAQAGESDYGQQLAALIDPSKLKTLGQRAANPRLQKAVYILATARSSGQDPGRTADFAIRLVGMTNAIAASLTREALLRNLTIAERLGCLTPQGLEEMRRGRSPTIRAGPCAGQELSVDHIIPRAVCPELDNVIANLELMPQRMNERKGSKVGARQRDLAGKLHKAGLLSDGGLAVLLRHR